MHSTKLKLAFSILGLALLATPAFAQRPQHLPYRDSVQQQSYPLGTYPNPVSRSGSAASRESGAEFDINRAY